MQIQAQQNNILDRKNEDGHSSFALLSSHQIVPLEVTSVVKISIISVIEILRERERDCNSPQDEN